MPHLWRNTQRCGWGLLPGIALPVSSTQSLPVHPSPLHFLLSRLRCPLLLAGMVLMAYMTVFSGQMRKGPRSGAQPGAGAPCNLDSVCTYEQVMLRAELFGKGHWCCCCWPLWAAAQGPWIRSLVASPGHSWS